MCIIFLVFYSIGYFKLFEKINILGWKALIPFYNEYLLCNKIEVNKKGKIIYLIINFISTIGIILSIVLILIAMIMFLILILMLIFFLFIYFQDTFIWFLNTAVKLLYILTFVLPISLLIFNLSRGYMFYKLSLHFGKDRIYSMILGIFNIVGTIILGFDNSVYNEKIMVNKKN